MGYPRVILDPHALEGILDYERIMGLIRDLLLAPEDEVAVAERSSLARRGVWLGAMPAAGRGVQTVKIVGVYPGNPLRGLPLVRGLQVVLEEETGEPLAIVDAGPPTGYRTAAASCLALRLLGYGGGGTLLLVGAGYQALHHARCIGSVYGVDRILVYSRRLESAEGLAQRLGGRSVRRLSPETVGAADVVVLATTSEEPILREEHVRDDQFIVSVGAPRPIVELAPSLLERLECLLVDTRRGFYSESGEALFLEGLDREPRIVELSEALRGGGGCPPLRGPRVYKSVGYSLFDLASALLIAESISTHNIHGK